MKIGIVLSNTPSYSETFFNAKIDKLKEKGVEVVLFSKKKRDYHKTRVIAPLDHTVLGLMRFFLIALVHYSKLRKFYILELESRNDKKRALKNTFLNVHMLTEKLDWIHFGYATATINRENVASIIGAKMAVSLRGYDINVYPLQNENCYALLWKKIDKVHSVSNYLLNKAYTLGLAKNTDYKIIHDAVATKHILDKTEAINFIKSNNKGCLEIVTIARLNWVKGVQHAIQAMEVLKKQKINFKYVVIGGGTKQEYEYLYFLIQELGLKEHVKLLGELSHLESLEFLKTADVYVQPSIGEGFCTSVVEAQALGKICIVTDAGGLPENVLHSKTGWVVPKMNPVAMANQIMEFYNTTNEIKRTMALAAIERVENNFTTKQQLEEFIKFYSKK